MAKADKDTRTFIRVHDHMDEHPKIEPLSDAAFRLFMSSLFYCSRNRTDGRISDAAWQKRGTARARRELERELVHRPGHGCEACPQPPAGHVQVHDYLDWQRSAAEIAELSEKRAESGRRGGKARARGQANASQVLEQTGGKTEAESESESESDTSLRSVGRTRAMRLPDDFVITDEMRSWAHEQGWADRWVDAITERFCDYWRAKPGREGTKLDWPATWRNWLRREAEHGQPVAAAAGTGLRSWEL